MGLWPEKGVKLYFQIKCVPVQAKKKIKRDKDDLFNIADNISSGANSAT